MIKFKKSSEIEQKLKRNLKYKENWKCFYKTTAASEREYLASEVVCKWELWNLEDFIERELEK